MDVERDRLVMDHQGPLRALAKAMSCHLPTADFDDLLSQGQMALLGAAADFDPRRGFQFWTFACPRARGAMLDWARRQDTLNKHQRARVKAGKDCPIRTTSLDALGVGDSEENTLHASFGAEDADGIMIQADAVKYLLKGLSQMNREMFLAHYLLGERMASIGKRYGIGEAAVSLRMKESREFLQKRLRRGDKA